MLKFIKSLFSSIPEYVPNPAATPEQKWALACAAPLAHINSDEHEWLHGGPPDDVSQPQIQAVLGAAWGIENREDLLGTLQFLESAGHRAEYERIRQLFETKGEFQRDASELLQGEPDAQNITAEAMVEFRKNATGMLDFWKEHRSILAWDLARAISLCRWGAAVGYLQEEEAWQRILGYAGQLRQSLGSWAELGQNYRAGFNFWSDDDDDDDLVHALGVLQDPENKNSPWQLNRWS